MREKRGVVRARGTTTLYLIYFLELVIRMDVELSGDLLVIMPTTGWLLARTGEPAPTPCFFFWGGELKKVGVALCQGPGINRPQPPVVFLLSTGKDCYIKTRKTNTHSTYNPHGTNEQLTRDVLTRDAAHASALPPLVVSTRAVHPTEE